MATDATDKLLVASVLFALGAAGVMWFTEAYKIDISEKFDGTWGIFYALVGGLVLGILIGKATEHYTSERKRHAQDIAFADAEKKEIRHSPSRNGLAPKASIVFRRSQRRAA